MELCMYYFGKAICHSKIQLTSKSLRKSILTRDFSARSVLNTKGLCKGLFICVSRLVAVSVQGLQVDLNWLLSFVSSLVLVLWWVKKAADWQRSHGGSDVTHQVTPSPGRCQGGKKSNASQRQIYRRGDGGRRTMEITIFNSPLTAHALTHCFFLVCKSVNCYILNGTPFIQE